jgi:periplasmic protein CpxP/Spy
MITSRLRQIPSPVFGMILIVGAALAPASFAGEHRCPHGKHGDHTMSPEKMHEKMAQRMTRLRESLALTAEQATAWTEFETNMKPEAKAQPSDWAAMKKLPAPERMTRKVEHMKTHLAWMESRIPVVAAFYSKLTPAQQKTFDREFMRHGRHHRHGDQMHKMHKMHEMHEMHEKPTS